MRLTCNRKDLHEGLRTAGRIVTLKSTLPILRNVLLDARDNRLRVLATDFEQCMELTVPATVSGEGAVSVPAHLITDILGLLPDVELSLSVEESDVLRIGCLRAELRSDYAIDYAIRGLPAADFPKFPEVDTQWSVEIDQAVLKRLVRETIFAVSANEMRALLTGVFTVLGDGVLQMVATDTHRLAISTGALIRRGDELLEEMPGFIIPARALRELARKLSDEAGPTLEVCLTPTLARFRMEGFVLVSRLIDGVFPHFKRVIPKEHEKRLVLDTQEFLGALRRVCIIWGQHDTPKVVLAASGDGMLNISTDAGEVGRAHEQIQATHEGEAVEIAFNGRYLTDMLAVTDAEQVAIETANPLNPAVVRPVPTGEEPEGRSYLYVLMPMAVQ